MLIHRSVKHTITKRAAARKRRLAQEAKSPGQVGDKLRRKMGDALADIFSEAGVKLYADSVIKMKDGLEGILTEGISGLEGTIKEELGKRGLSHASGLFKPWISELVEEIIHFGLEEISGGLEDLADTAAAEFSKKPEDEEEGDEELLGLGEEEPAEEVETTEEEPVAEPPAEEGMGMEPAPMGGEPGAGIEIPGMEAPGAAPGGEAGASFKNDPYAPRTWRQPSRARKVASTLELTPEHLVSWAGGLDVAMRKAKTLQAAVELLQRVQAAAVKRLVAKSAAVAVREVEPLMLLDYASRFWAHR
jgi:hypothetical protein